jgi:hypothetical protein
MAKTSFQNPKGARIEWPVTRSEPDVSGVELSLAAAIVGEIDPLGVSDRESAGAVGHIYANYKRLVGRAVEVFGDEIAASTWLSTPSPDFENKPPLQVAQEHSYDPEVLEPVLVRIEHGVYF